MAKVYVGLMQDDPNLLAQDLERLREVVEVIQHPGPHRPSDEEKREALRDADGVVLGRSGGGLSAEILDGALSLKVVGVVGGSVAMVEPELLLDRGIRILHTGWAMANAVAEFTLAMMLCGLRDIPHMVEVMQTEGWGKARGALDLTGKSVGLVGFGMIARRVVELLVPFRVRVQVFDPFVSGTQIRVLGAEVVDLNSLLSTCEVISLHAGLTEDTRGMLGAEELAWIPDGGLLVNTARADLVDEKALIAELKKGRIRAALNVFWQEPLSANHPLRAMDNVILTPHGGGLTRDTQERHSRSIVDDMIRFFKGEPPEHEVTRERLGRMT